MATYCLLMLTMLFLVHRFDNSPLIIYLTKQRLALRKLFWGTWLAFMSSPHPHPQKDFYTLYMTRSKRKKRLVSP